MRVVDVDEEAQQLADGAFPGHDVGQGLVGLDLVAVPPACFLLDQVARFGQVDDEAVGGALGDLQGCG